MKFQDYILEQLCSGAQCASPFCVLDAWAVSVYRLLCLGIWFRLGGRSGWLTPAHHRIKDTVFCYMLPWAKLSPAGAVIRSVNASTTFRSFPAWQAHRARVCVSKVFGLASSYWSLELSAFRFVRSAVRV